MEYREFKAKTVDEAIDTRIYRVRLCKHRA